MSISATLWSLKFPAEGYSNARYESAEVIAQTVPPHIGSPTPGEGYEDNSMESTHSQAAHSLDFLADDPDLLLAMVFGSTADGSQRPDSDIDVAVYPRKQLASRKRQLLADEIAIATGRAVDLIDLTHVDGALLRQILGSGKVVFSKDPGILGTLSERLLDWQEDFEPQLNALLETRLQRFTTPRHGS